MRCVYGYDAQVGAFVASLIRHVGSAEYWGSFVAIGVADGNTLVAGAVFNNYRPQYRDIEISFSAASPKWARRGIIREIFRYPFVQLGCARLTTITGRKNRRARRLDEGLGFKLEGVVRKGFGRDDAMIYGMLKRECKWLGEPDGKE